MAFSLTIRAWWTPKAGHEASEYEDAYRIADATGDAPLRIAVADGATGATFSALWAELLTTDYVMGALTPASLPARLPLLARAWQTYVEAEPLPWYAQAKVSRDGSHAALLGFTLEPRTATYTVLSVGDCAIFHLRPAAGENGAYSLVLAFPFERWTDFNAFPALIGTQTSAQPHLDAYIRTAHGTFSSGDRFYLMSDALAAWFLRETEKDRAPWRWLAAIDTARAEMTLAAMIEDLRSAQHLKNDDVTIVSVQVG